MSVPPLLPPPLATAPSPPADAPARLRAWQAISIVGLQLAVGAGAFAAERMSVPRPVAAETRETALARPAAATVVTRTPTAAAAATGSAAAPTATATPVPHAASAQLSSASPAPSAAPAPSTSAAAASTSASATGDSHDDPLLDEMKKAVETTSSHP